LAQIFKLDYSNPSSDMPLAGGAVAANERFHRLAWGPLQTEGMPHGLIAGGLVDGSVNLYNPARIIGSPIGAEPSDGVSSGALVTKMQKHSGPVRGLEFNSFSPNLLASGAEDGELCIWDLARPAQPSLYPALKGGAGGQPAAGEVSYLGVEQEGAAHPRQLVPQRHHRGVGSEATAAGDLLHRPKQPATVLGDAVEPRGGDAAHRRVRRRQVPVASDLGSSQLHLPG
jgi:hypothetical protein